MKQEAPQNPESSWFGFSQVSPEEKTNNVINVFSSVAENYDLMNDLMSAGLHRLWKNTLVVHMNPRAGEAILDVAGGTGDIAIRCAQHTKGKANITICDLNHDMMRVGRDKSIDKGWLSSINWVNGNAECLPFKPSSFDLVCIAFGLRNVTHIDTALKQFTQMLRPGGRFFCLEFSPQIHPALKSLYEAYSFSVLPWLGEKVAHDRHSYQYLAESIQRFPTPSQLAKRMEKASFEQVKYKELMGGIAYIHSGWVL